MLPEAPMEGLGDTQVVLQGAIDCWFEENGMLYIVDFKTDAVKDMEELKDRYTLQLFLYKKALEELVDKQVGGCYIYSLRTGEYIAVDD
jgi:ATP-dependent helicase/nuclease subunit A